MSTQHGWRIQERLLGGTFNQEHGVFYDEDLPEAVSKVTGGHILDIQEMLKGNYRVTVADGKKTRYFEVNEVIRWTGKG